MTENPNVDPLVDDEDDAAGPLELLRIVERISEAGAQDPESENFLAEIVEQLARATASEQVVLSLTDPATDGLDMRAAHGFPEAPADLNYVQDGVHGWVLKVGSPVVLEGPEKGGGLPLLSFERTALLAAPVQVGDHRMGAVSVLRSRREGGHTEDDMLLVTTVASLLGGLIGHAREKRRSQESIRKVIESLTMALDARDSYTRGHSQRVAMYSLAIANELEATERYSFVRDIRNSLVMSALLHDIGKIGIRDEILYKPGKLTAEEFELIKSHPQKGADIVRMVPGFDENVMAGILQHHERFDGKGYPNGRTGDRIHVFGRIIGLADTFDAIVTSRPYSTASSFSYAMGRIEELSGTAFDPELVQAMHRAMKDQSIWRELASISSDKPAAESVRKEGTDTSGVDKKLRKIFGRNITDLPTLPHVVSQILEKTHNPNVNLDEIVKLVSTDQSLVSTYLRLVNSAFYGFNRRITTLKQAITLLGFRSVRNIVVNAGVVGIFRKRAFNNLYRHRLWDHSVSCAVAARVLAEKSGYGSKEEAFTAGLLHDIGKVVIDQYAPKDSAAIMRRVEAGRTPREAESEVLGVDHTTIGAWIAERWHLPKPLCWVIEHHHEPTAANVPDAELVRLVAAANGICRIQRSEDPEVVTMEIEDYVASPENHLKLGIDEATAAVHEIWTGKSEAMKTFGPALPAAPAAGRDEGEEEVATGPGALSAPPPADSWADRA